VFPKRPLSTSSLEQTVITCQQRWRLTRQRRWDFVDMRIPGTMVCIFCLYIYMCVCISIYIIQYIYIMLIMYYLYHVICLTIYLSFCLSIYLSFFLSIYLSFYLSIYHLYIYLSIYPSIYHRKHDVCLCLKVVDFTAMFIGKMTRETMVATCFQTNINGRGGH